MTAPARYRCHTCGATLTSWAAAERHADTHPVGARIDIDLDPPTSEGDPQP